MANENQPKDTPPTPPPVEPSSYTPPPPREDGVAWAEKAGKGHGEIKVIRSDR